MRNRQIEKGKNMNQLKPYFNSLQLEAIREREAVKKVLMYTAGESLDAVLRNVGEKE